MYTTQIQELTNPKIAHPVLNIEANAKNDMGFFSLKTKINETTMLIVPKINEFITDLLVNISFNVISFRGTLKTQKLEWLIMLTMFRYHEWKGNKPIFKRSANPIIHKEKGVFIDMTQENKIKVLPKAWLIK